MAALITGAGVRLGADIARGLAADGHFVVLHYNRSTEVAEKLASGIHAERGQCGLLPADLTDCAAVAGLIDACAARYRVPDVLVNTMRRVIISIRSNRCRPRRGTRTCRPAWRRRSCWRQRLFRALRPRAGTIVNMLDFKVRSLNPDYFSYTVAKAGLAAAPRMLAMAFKGVVRVNGIAPGLTMRSGRQNEVQFAHTWAMTPLGKGPTPLEIVGAVRFEIDTHSLNGQIVTLDGGASLRPRDRDVSVDDGALAAAGHEMHYA